MDFSGAGRAGAGMDLGAQGRVLNLLILGLMSGFTGPCGPELPSVAPRTWEKAGVTALGSLASPIYQLWDPG